MTQLVLKKFGEITKFDPARTTIEIHASEAAARIARKIKDPAKFREALDRNLGAKREAAAEYARRFPHQGTGSNQYISRVEIPCDSATDPRLAFCAALGFSDRRRRRCRSAGVA